ncbi:hypothetical protein [Rhizobium lentis]|nr:hypothetical protein [Rhizobium lentis]
MLPNAVVSTRTGFATRGVGLVRFALFRGALKAFSISLLNFF